ncbi:BglG family transcription antiterminator [Staphylococcus carnosus]|uniref:BglG family transcription antiterminator n=1 Tax=Staphylococcus carnosus TaxID=1281 RepID=UPI00081AAB80|nr:BglG family transcription antiterminator [Staphylococcus carnosus]ANZ34413.1 PTS mannose transporter subunit IIA [Staphylococcus carnosus]UTB79505.1 PTS mannose transporter subunit IIA [Staphylococcus carnosus]UTB84272.1 PTS mannose transporter subunit IIA [Staphylococcus carnosus]
MIERQIKLIQLFLNNEYQFLTSDEVASFLDVSNRTIRNDIKYINSSFLKDVIKSIKSRGYHLDTDRYSVEYIESSLKDYTDKDNKILLTLAYQLLMHEEQLTLIKLEKEYHLTKNEMLDYLNRIKAWCEKFDVIINMKQRKGLEVIGSETDINNAILHLNQLSSHENSVETLILNELPKAHVQIIKEIIKRTLGEFGVKTSDIQIEQLIIHLILIMKRRQSQNELISEEVNDEAFNISKRIVDEINGKLGYDINTETIQLFSFFIGYHFDKFDLGVQQLFIESYINLLIEKMENRISVQFTKDKTLKENLYSHFSRTYLRIMKDVYLNNPLTKEIKTLYPFVFNVLYEIVQRMSDDSGVELTEDEIAFLTIHFQSSIDRNEQDVIKVVIACFYGIGISQLLATKISKFSNRIEVIDTLKLEEIEQYDFSHIDLLMTTHQPENNKIPNHLELLQVTPLFNDNDQHQLQQFMNRKLKPTMHIDEMGEVNFIVGSTEDQEITMPLIFQKADEILNHNHALIDGYIETALEREKMSSTYIGKEIAIPHGDPEKVSKSHVIIFRSNKGFYWKENKVKLVFFLAIAQRDIELTKRIIQTIAHIDEKKINELIYLDDTKFKAELLNLIKG